MVCIFCDKETTSKHLYYNEPICRECFIQEKKVELDEICKKLKHLEKTRILKVEEIHKLTLEGED